MPQVLAVKDSQKWFAVHDGSFVIDLVWMAHLDLVDIGDGLIELHCCFGLQIRYRTSVLNLPSICQY